MTKVVVSNLVDGTSLLFCAKFAHKSNTVSFDCRDVGKLDIFPISKSSMIVSVCWRLQVEVEVEVVDNCKPDGCLYSSSRFKRIFQIAHCE